MKSNLPLLNTLDDIDRHQRIQISQILYGKSSPGSVPTCSRGSQTPDVRWWITAIREEKNEERR